MPLESLMPRVLPSDMKDLNPLEMLEHGAFNFVLFTAIFFAAGALILGRPKQKELLATAGVAD